MSFILIMITILTYSVMYMREQLFNLQTKLDKQLEIIYLLNDERISREFIQSKIDENIVCDFDNLDYYRYSTYLIYMNNIYRNTKHKYKKCEDHIIEYYYNKHDKLFNKNKYNTCLYLE